jgi:hypothetical protein
VAQTWLFHIYAKWTTHGGDVVIWWKPRELYICCMAFRVWVSSFGIQFKFLENSPFTRDFNELYLSVIGSWAFVWRMYKLLWRTKFVVCMVLSISKFKVLSMLDTKFLNKCGIQSRILYEMYAKDSKFQNSKYAVIFWNTRIVLLFN